MHACSTVSCMRTGEFPKDQQHYSRECGHFQIFRFADLTPNNSFGPFYRLLLLALEVGRT